MKLCGCGWGGLGLDEQEAVPDCRISLKEQWIEEQQARRRAEAEALAGAEPKGEGKEMPKGRENAKKKRKGRQDEEDR